MPLEPLAEKYRAFNWHVWNATETIWRRRRDVDQARLAKGQPHVMIANAVPGKGVSFMEGDYIWHGKPPTRPGRRSPGRIAPTAEELTVPA